MLKSLVLLLLAFPLTDGGVAHAQGVEDLDGPSSEPERRERREARARVQRALEDEVIREVVRGWYAKAGLGSTNYLLTYGPVLKGGTALNMSFGNDFLNTERNSANWEISYATALHSGMHYEVQYTRRREGATTPFVQGNIRSFAAIGTVGYSIYPSRRIGLGARAGGGVMMVPLLMYPEAYERDVVGNRWGGERSPLHDGILPMVLAGPSIEYYTKLSHFSVGLEVDAAYVIGFDLGVTAGGFLKYTF